MDVMINLEYAGILFKKLLNNQETPILGNISEETCNVHASVSLVSCANLLGRYLSNA